MMQKFGFLDVSTAASKVAEVQFRITLQERVWLHETILPIKVIT